VTTHVSRIDQLSYALALRRIPGIGDRSSVVILNAFPGPEDILEASQQQLDSLGKRVAQAIKRVSAEEFTRLLGQARRCAEDHYQAGFSLVSLFDEDYPALLRLLPDAPSVLFVRGSVQALNEVLSMAVIGTRSPTACGFTQAYQLSLSAARAGIVIVSGLARGIDTAAHRGALASGGRTVAVLANPIDTVYPVENTELAEQIIARDGALVSEYGMKERIRRSSFIHRDRIQSGLSVAVVAVQTDITGGTMHTVGFAQKQNRLLVCPSPCPEERDAPQTAGVRKLLANGEAHILGEWDEQALTRKLLKHREHLLGSAATEGKGHQKTLPGLDL
jgi:DNA processing protein